MLLKLGGLQNFYFIWSIYRG